MMIKNYYNDEKLRKSMSQLADFSFGLDFELLYQKGYWDPAYGCYSILEDDKIVSNVSYHLLELEKAGKRYKVMSIGSVMTYPEYRKKGYARTLMEAVLKDHQVDAYFLGANETVLDFYPRFGFEATDHLKYMDENVSSYKIGPKGRVLDIDADLKLIDEYVKNRIKNSKDMYVYGDDYLKMFYALYLYNKNMYLHEDAIIVCSRQKDILHVHDIYAKHPIDFKALVGPYTEGVTKIYYDFEVAIEGIEAYEDLESYFFVKTDIEELKQAWSYPGTSVT